MRGQVWIALGVSAMTSMACRTSQVLTPNDEFPVADAKVLKLGVPVEQSRDGSIADLVFPYAGEPVAITLDGSSSYDPDGRIAGYRWLSATRAPDAGLPPPWTPDAGPPSPFWRSSPNNVDGTLDEVSPTIMLGAGVWAFALWVVDDQGNWSSPDTIRFIVGDPPPAPGDGGAGGDASVARDAGADAGTGADATAGADAAPADAEAADASVSDAGPVADAGSSLDAGTDAAP